MDTYDYWQFFFSAFFVTISNRVSLLRGAVQFWLGIKSGQMVMA
jgi:hypothetical protein